MIVRRLGTFLAIIGSMAIIMWGIVYHLLHVYGMAGGGFIALLAGTGALAIMVRYYPFRFRDNPFETEDQSSLAIDVAHPDEASKQVSVTIGHASKQVSVTIKRVPVIPPGEIMNKADLGSFLLVILNCYMPLAFAFNIASGPNFKDKLASGLSMFAPDYVRPLACSYATGLILATVLAIDMAKRDRRDVRKATREQLQVIQNPFIHLFEASVVGFAFLVAYALVLALACHGFLYLLINGIFASQGSGDALRMLILFIVVTLTAGSGIGYLSAGMGLVAGSSATGLILDISTAIASNKRERRDIRKTRREQLQHIQNPFVRAFETSALGAFFLIAYAVVLGSICYGFLYLVINGIFAFQSSGEAWGTMLLLFIIFTFVAVLLAHSMGLFRRQTFLPGKRPFWANCCGGLLGCIFAAVGWWAGGGYVIWPLNGDQPVDSWSHGAINGWMVGATIGGLNLGFLWGTLTVLMKHLNRRWQPLSWREFPEISTSAKPVDLTG